MADENYKKQVDLLLKVMPEVAKETCFALHGGSAINLFVRDMPRLSVDIDLTYLVIEEREMTLNNMNSALKSIKQRVEKTIPDIRIEHKADKAKLFISEKGIDIKLEVNMVGRGTLQPPEKRELSKLAEKTFDVFVAMPVVPLGQLYGGKICAALDRQHPRDLFDVKYLLDNEGITETIKTGFLFSLSSSDRPLHELLFPNLLDQRSAMSNQFSGMSTEEFTYDDFEETRERLIRAIHEILTIEDKRFLLSLKNATPDWGIYDFEKFPSVQWKLKNLLKLKASNPGKYADFYHRLEESLNA